MPEQLEPEELRAPTDEDLNSSNYSVWIRATIFRPVSILMLFVAILVVGVVTVPRIRTEMLPGGLSGGHCAVYIPIRDGTPREVMDQVTKPTEDLLRTLPGLKNVISSSGSNRAMVRLEFDAKYDMSVMVAEVRDRVDRARVSWPDTADRYMIWRQRDSDLPVIVASIGIENPDRSVDIDYLFDEVIRKRLERVDGVARVDIWGTLEKRVEIQLDRERVHAYGIDIRRLIERLTQENTAVTAGRVRESGREFIVRLDGRFKDFDEILDYPIDQNFRLGDVAAVGFRASVRSRMAHVDTRRAQVVVVSKESSANAVEVSTRVQEELDRIESSLKRTVRGVTDVITHAWLDQGSMITSSVSGLQESGIYGGLCAIIVLFGFFRRANLTALVTLAIPFSLLMTIVWIYFSGRTFNILSLMGLSLGIGMLVDNSIVVVENILRKQEQGLSPRRGAIEGVREVGVAVSLATLTTVLVLFPILFMGEGQFKKMTQAFGLPLCVSVLASLVVALVFIPQGAILLQRSYQGSGKAPRYSRINRMTRNALGWALKHRLEGLLIAFALLASTQFAFRWLAKADFDAAGPRGVEMNVELPPNFTLGEAEEAMAFVQRSIRRRAEENGVELDTVTSWFDSSGGEVNIFFPPGKRLGEEVFFQKIRPLPKKPGVIYHYGFESFSSDQGRQRVRVFVEANDYDRLIEAEELVRKTLENKSRFPYLGDVARWSESQREELRIDINRRNAEQLGVDTATVSRMVSWALRGAALPDFVREEREFPMWIAYDDWQKESVDELNNVLVYRPGQEPVSLDNLASYHMAPSSGEIHRRNGKLTAGLSASVEGDAGYGFRNRLEVTLRKLQLPEGVRISMRPASGGFESDLQSTVQALGMALCLVFFVMGVLFESWLLPLSVLFCVPFAFFGSIWLLLITRVSLDAVGMIGMLMLVGIVVNNAIVLVDYINRQRKSGFSRREAILESVQVRFRPIWMTAMTTIFGLMPLAVIESQGESVDYRALSVVIMGGLGTSTFFTLIIVPLLYTVLDDVSRVFRAFFMRRPNIADSSDRDVPQSVDA